MITNLDQECPVRRCENDLQDVDGLLICTGCGFVPEECDCTGCDCCDDDGNHVHDDATCFHPCCPEADGLVEVRACRVCGCTDAYGCDFGCSWVEADLCSACTPDRQETTA